jgi:hypothetical protein
VLATVEVCITEGVKDANEEFESIGLTDALDGSDGLYESDTDAVNDKEADPDERADDDCMRESVPIGDSDG